MALLDKVSGRKLEGGFEEDLDVKVRSEWELELGLREGVGIEKGKTRR